jgi:hypothetical protein
MVFLLCLSIQVILINAYFQLLKLSNYFTNVLMRDLFSVVAFFCLLFCWHTDDSVCKITFSVFNNSVWYPYISEIRITDIMFISQKLRVPLVKTLIIVVDVNLTTIYNHGHGVKLGNWIKIRIISVYNQK